MAFIPGVGEVDDCFIVGKLPEDKPNKKKRPGKGSRKARGKYRISERNKPAWFDQFPITLNHRRREVALTFLEIKTAVELSKHATASDPLAKRVRAKTPPLSKQERENLALRIKLINLVGDPPLCLSCDTKKPLPEIVQGQRVPGIGKGWVMVKGYLPSCRSCWNKGLRKKVQ